MIRLTLVWSPAPREVIEQSLSLPDGATARDALAACSAAAAWVQATDAALQPGIWGRLAQWESVLEEGDRVELCRALKGDPKVARRERFARQGKRGTGLFARQRSGGKAGY